MKTKTKKQRKYKVVDNLDANVWIEFHASSVKEAYSKALDQAGFHLIDDGYDIEDNLKQQ